MIATLTITVIDTGPQLIFFYEYKELALVEAGVTADGKKMNGVVSRFEDRADKNGLLLEVIKRPMLKV
ncbi:MAG: hypothetical protein WC365_03600 [Candidatus Babeliales bacterium]|jgi:hypothetical protein